MPTATKTKKNQPTLREIRTQASLLGITTMNKDRYKLQAEIAVVKKANAEAAKDEREQEAAALLELKKELATRGLPVEGTQEELKLRLAQAQDGSINRADRLIYQAVAVACIVLGIIALGISVPHIAAEVANLMNIPVVVAYLFAIVIDCGIVGLKSVDIVATKFAINRNVRWSVRGLLGMCLGFSVLLNASQFVRHLQNPGVMNIMLAITCAVFIVSFVYLMFQVGSMMITSCRVKGDGEDETTPDDPAVAFRNNAKLWETLQKAAKALPQNS